MAECPPSEYDAAMCSTRYDGLLVSSYANYPIPLYLFFSYDPLTRVLSPELNASCLPLVQEDS